MKDYCSFICASFMMIVHLIAGVVGLCNHTMAYQCLRTAEQQFQTAVNNDFNQFCKSLKDNLTLKRCLQQSTGSCERATQEMFLIQATRFLRPIETQCRYLVSQTSTAEASTSCRRDAVPFCYRDLVTKFDANNDIKKAFGLANPLVDWQFHQQDVCSKLEDEDMEKIQHCIESNGCQNEPVFTDMEDNKYISYSTVFSLMTGICQPECNSIASKLQKANDCLRQDNIVNYITGTSEYNPLQPSCDDLNKAFQCVRLNIQTCKTGSDYLYILYRILHINPDIQHACPEIDTAFYISKGAILSYLNLSGMVVFLMSLFTSTYML